MNGSTLLPETCQPEQDSSSPTVRGTLAVVCSNPPTTSGQRTTSRIEMAREILNFERTHLVNLFSLPTYRTSGVSELGTDPTAWTQARPMLEAALNEATAVLLAYGISKPTGSAAQHHTAQVQWLEQQIDARALPVWWVGEAPRHPSRWHRYTYRMFPNDAFPQALRIALRTR